jgi:spore coat protein U-like protein
MNSKLLSIKVLVAAFGFALMPFGAVHAVPMNVTANVAGTCLIANVVDVTFGDISADQGTTNDVDFDGSFTWRCSNLANVDIAIDDGNHSILPNTRRMQSDTLVTPEYISYTLSKDANGGVYWGPTGGDDVNVTGAGMGLGNEATLTVYGQIPGGTFDLNSVDTYSDQVDITYIIN